MTAVLYSPELIIESICMQLGLKKSAIIGPLRKRELAECRFLIMYFIQHYTDLKPHKIGTYLGNRERSTVRYGIESCMDLCKHDPQFKNKFIKVKSKLDNLK